MSMIAAVLFRRKTLIFTIFAGIVALTCAVTLLMPKKYESRMKVFVKHERADSVVSPDNNNSVVRGEVSESDVNSEIELLTNSELLRQVVVRHKLHEAESAGSGQKPEERVDRAVRRLVSNLHVSPVRKASIIQVVYSSEDPSQCVAVLSSLAELYLQEHLRVHRTAGTHEFFRKEAQQYETQLQDSQNRLAEFRWRNNIVLLPEQKELLVRRVLEDEQALNETTTSLAEASARIAALTAELEKQQPRLLTQSRVITNQSSVEKLHTMLVELQNRRTALLTKFHSGDRMVRELDEQIGDTSAALQRARDMTAVEQTTDVNPLRQSAEGELARAKLLRAGLESRRASLAGTLQTWRARLAALDSATSGHDALQREIKQTEESLVLYSKKQEEARLADSLDEQKIANVSIAERPARPYLPSRPIVPLNIALGVLLGFVTSIGAAFALELNRKTFESADELRSALNLPVLASVPVEGA